MAHSFPVNPENGTIFELQDGVLFQYDALIRSWIKIATNSIPVPVANNTRDGLMTASDLQKLNRLMIPPPVSTITGNDCYTPFRRGVIALQSGDDLINIEGDVSIQNIDQFGDHISKDVPFQIHQHTYGYDFNLDLNNLVNELIDRGQLKIIGPTGDRGDKGPVGDAGIDGILSGPQGLKGPRGIAPPCPTTIQTEVIQTRTKRDLNKALTDARIIIDETDPTKYILEFDRQVVGSEGASAEKFNMRVESSSWVLAVANSAGTAQQVYYVDLEPIIEAVRNKFLSEVDRLKKGYEDITKFWIQTMSDLFDEQKAALCCALEFCQSKTNSDQLRQHMESVAAAALPDSRIYVEQRYYPNHEFVSGTALWPRIGQPDLCEGGHDRFPHTQAAQAVPNGVKLQVDPLLHLVTGNKATTILEAGRYNATITSFSLEINKQCYADLLVQYNTGKDSKIARFLNKGAYSKLEHAKAAYEGLTISFDHAGGEVAAFYNMLPSTNVSGSVEIEFFRESDIQTIQSITSCDLDVSDLTLFQNAWDRGECCGLVVELFGQDYIILLSDKHCGGKIIKTPCSGIVRENPAIAWPTLDKVSFVGLPSAGSIKFRYDASLCEILKNKLDSGDYDNPRNVDRIKGQFDIVLFPTTS